MSLNRICCVYNDKQRTFLPLMKTNTADMWIRFNIMFMVIYNALPIFQLNVIRAFQSLLMISRL